MEEVIEALGKYVSEVTGLSLIAHKADIGPLPQYLAQLYSLYELQVGAHRLLGVLLRDTSSFQPAKFEKHLERLLDAAPALTGYCLIAEDLPNYVRRRLIDGQTPFVLPWRQLHWPELGMAVQAWKKREATAAAETLKPATQVVILHELLEGEGQPVSVRALSERLGYTTMTVSRAFDEITANKLGRVRRQGRERLLDYPNGRQALWQDAKKILRSPVRSRERVMAADLPGDNRLLAGETALAKMSMLSGPAEPVFALGREQWKRIEKKLTSIPIKDEGTCLVEVWRYDPRLFTRDGVVDRFSLYLSLRDKRDERLEMALDDMMEKGPW